MSVWVSVSTGSCQVLSLFIHAKYYRTASKDLTFAVPRLLAWLGPSRSWPVHRLVIKELTSLSKVRDISRSEITLTELLAGLSSNDAFSVALGQRGLAFTGTIISWFTMTVSRSFLTVSFVSTNFWIVCRSAQGLPLRC